MSLYRKRFILRSIWKWFISRSKVWRRSFFRSFPEISTFKKFILGFTKLIRLSNFDIIEKCKELNINNFKGVYMRDELTKFHKNTKVSNRECMIINIDESRNEGTHWTCLFIKDMNGCVTAYYFDSYGFPPTEEVKKYCSMMNLVYSSFEIQKMNEVICGHYCIYVLYKLSNGYLFDDILEELYFR